MLNLQEGMANINKEIGEKNVVDERWTRR